MKYLRLAVSTFALAAAVPASAATFAFSFSDTSSTLVAWGTLQTSNALNSLGGYDITSMTGFVSGTPITGLVPNPSPPNYAFHTFPSGAYFYYDNVLYSPGAPHVDIGGILFTVGGVYYNIYHDTDDVLSYYIPASSSFSSTSGVFAITEIPAPTPEPASWAMMLGGFGLVGGVMRARRKIAVSYS